MNRPHIPLQGENKLSVGDGVKFLTPYLRKYRFKILLSILLVILGAIFQIAGPWVLKDISNYLQAKDISTIDMNRVKELGILVIILYLSSITFSYVSGFLMTDVTQQTARRLRDDISNKINQLPLQYFDSRPFGDVLSRVTNDVDAIGANLTQIVNQSVQSIVLVIGILIMMTIESWVVMLISVISIPIVFFVMFIFIKMSQKYFRAQQKTLGEINGHIEEAYSGQRVIKAFNQETMNLGLFMQFNDDLEITAWKSQFFSSLIMPALFFVGNIRYVLVICGGAMLGFPIGTILMFIQYTRQFNQPIDQLGQIANIMQVCLAAAGRVQEFLEEPEMAVETPSVVLDKDDVKGKVTFEHISFGYQPEKEIIHDFSCHVEPGMKVAIVGPTGAGKTTLVNLLMRFYEINSGKILIDEIDTRDITRENVTSLFGMVLQDTWLFEGTMLENLKYGNRNATFEEVEVACRACHVDHFIKSLPGGYQFLLDENANISHGQKQLLTIARAMIENAPMLILDEATSSVDTRTEHLIQAAMESLTTGRTSFVIAHRLSTIKNSDLILVMKDGNIVEQGNHDALMKLNGTYTELYNSQFANE